MRTLILILTSVLLLGIIKIPDKDWSERKGKKMITASINQIPAELDPTKLRLIEHFLLLQLYSQTLVRVDESGELISYLAKRWEYDAKKKEYIFTLDSNARFSDGTPVTAKDVAWSLSRHFWIGSPSIVVNYLSVALASAETIPLNHLHPAFEVINEHTVGIKLKSFYHPFLHVLSMPGFSITKYSDGTFLPIGSGPLKLEKGSEKNKLLFLRNNLFSKTLDLNQVTILESSGLDETKKMFADGSIDLALGVSRGNLNLKTLEKTKMAITLSESLAILHAYFNTKGMFENDDYRSTLSCLMSKAADEFSNTNPMLERLRSFFPNGVMPMQYYNQKDHCKLGTAISGVVRIMLSYSNFSPEFVEILERILKENHVKAKIMLGKPEEILASIKKKDYDIISFGYVGNFPDPDAFIDLLNTSSLMHAGEFDSRPYFEKLEKRRFESDLELRLNAYSKIFHELEQRNYFVPLFRFKIPIVHRNELSFPNTKFRYEGELWRIFWKKLILKSQRSLSDLFSLYSVVVPIVLGLVMTFLTGVAVYGVSDHAFTQSHQNWVDMFTENIRQDMVKGNHSEVFRKCKKFANDSDGVAHLVIKDFFGKDVCNEGVSSKASHLIKKIYFDTNGTELVGEVQVLLEQRSRNKIVMITLVFLLLGFSLLTLLLLKVGRSIQDSIIGPFITIHHALRAPTPDGLSSINLNGKLSEIIEIESSLKFYGNEIGRLQNLEMKSESARVFSEVASQVAHDIRSPLAALNMISSELGDVSEDKRLIIRNSIQRINDIANDLLAKGKLNADKLKINTNTEKLPLSESKLELILLASLVDGLVSEKRIQYRDKINIKIDSDLQGGLGCFVEAESKELKRILSNLVNNSIEAFAENIGEVIIELKTHEGWVNIAVKDNGVGIPQEILAELGKKGVSHGKSNSESGSGLGVFHAKKCIEKMSGHFSITSQLGKGTQIDIKIAQSADANLVYRIIDFIA